MKAWGGPAEGYEWPLSNHGIAVDNKDNVWIGGNGRGDSHMLKFTHDGKCPQNVRRRRQVASARQGID